VSDVELLAAYWTGSGPIELGRREWSLFDWRDRCACAAAAGFSGIGLLHSDIAHQLESRAFPEMKRIFDDSGLKYLELSYLQIPDYLADPDPVRPEAQRRRTNLFEAAQTIGARHIKVVTAGEPAEVGRLVDAFAELCRQAALHTDALLVYEFLPPPLDLNVGTLQGAIALIQEAAQHNGRLLLDTWPLTMAGVSAADMQMIPVGSIGWVELADGIIEPSYSIEQKIFERRLPGEGTVDIGGYIEASRGRGYDGPWGVEAMSDELRSLSVQEVYTRAYETGRAQFLR
jgi:sugar phosphate isomerase/epimerase